MQACRDCAIAALQNHPALVGGDELPAPVAEAIVEFLSRER